MKRIKTFSNFNSLESIDESRVYFLNDLKRKLQELVFDGNEWAEKLLHAQGKDIDSDTTFLNLDGENFSFSKESDIRKIYPEAAKELFDEPLDPNYPQSPDLYFGALQQNFLNNLSSRNKVKMGRVIKKLIPEISDKDLETFVNQLKAETSGFEIKLVKGDDIKKYYMRENCDEKSLNYGTLNNSCMMDRVSENPNIFDIYTKNPETCQLAVMLNSGGQLVARALVWKIDEVSYWESGSRGDNIEVIKQLPVSNWISQKIEPYSNNLFTAKAKELYFMDRVYYTKDWMENSFYKWAIEKNMIIKWRRSFSYKGQEFNPILSVKVNKLAYRQFPYVDTLNNYDVQQGKLCNYKLTSRGFELQSTQGRYSSTGTKLQQGVDKATNLIRRFKDYI